ncbi:unnamed protein product [Allacma fusca]|uniref:Coiled-coil domain-containing protein 104 n=1 Tax=Allacma fusca TaxID=39272 RepID=A0A8J2J386_9HEXA|nr:unnamed protein product [Allacma fusca]
MLYDKLRLKILISVALEQLWAAEDFNAFRRLMTRKNIDLQLQSLELLVAKYGVLSPSLRPPNSDPDDPSDPNGEEDFLQVVIRYTEPENTVFHSSLVTSTKCCPPPPPTPSPPPLHSPPPPSACQILSQKLRSCPSFEKAYPPANKALFNENGSCRTEAIEDKPSVVSSQILQQDEQQLLTGQLPTTPIDDNVKTFPPTEEAPPEEEQEEGSAEEVGAGAISTTVVEVSNELDEETVAEIANQAPEQHRILTAVRRALDAPAEEGVTSVGSPKLELAGIGSEEEIERRREYLRAQRDKLVALKKREREKQLNNFDRRGKSPSGPGRPKSAKAAQIALKSPESITTSDKALQARRALAQRLKQELVE